MWGVGSGASSWGAPGESGDNSLPAGADSPFYTALLGSVSTSGLPAAHANGASSFISAEFGEERWEGDFGGEREREWGTRGAGGGLPLQTLGRWANEPVPAVRAGRFSKTPLPPRNMARALRRPHRGEASQFGAASSP